jgi:hypothetical protein
MVIFPKEEWTGNAVIDEKVGKENAYETTLKEVGTEQYVKLQERESLWNWSGKQFFGECWIG